jgi:predicted ATPase/class 3 adenylate cyclase
MTDMEDSKPSRVALPEGTVTFLFTDIEGSTKLLNALGDEYPAVLANQRRIVRESCSRLNGHEVDTQGDSFFISFQRATQAVAAAVEIQRTMARHSWPGNAQVRLRIGLHTGEPLVADEGYIGMDVHRAARIAYAGHGGQVLLSETTAALVRDELPEGVSLVDLGRHRLKDMHVSERIRQLAIEGLLAEFPPLISPEAPPNNLPMQRTPFIGRDEELAVLNLFLSDPDKRLISILGAGGMGKTRLALACAEGQLSITEGADNHLEARFPHGAFFVPLAPLVSPASILPAIAEALDFQVVSGEGKGMRAGDETRSTKQQLLDYLRSKRLLLVMDNFEHLLQGTELLTEIMTHAPGVRILVTSREPLQLEGEHLFLLSGMKFPDPAQAESPEEINLDDYSALGLFRQCALRVQPDFQLGAEELAGAATICYLVGGMPLGIELAASWVNMLTAAEIAEEIRVSLDFLETRLRDVDKRHRSIRAVFDSAWDRLSRAERDLFQKLTVFQGGFTRKAAHDVAGASLDLLGRLASRSLLQFDQKRHKYEIHELLRQFGEERLAQDEEKARSLRGRHSGYYCDLLAGLEVALKGPRHMQAMQEIEAEIDNITAAWRWAAGQDRVSRLTDALGALDVYYQYSGLDKEGEQLFRYALDHLPASQSTESLRLRVRLISLVARYIPSKRIDEQRQWIEKGCELLRAPALAMEDTRVEEAYLISIAGDLEEDPKDACHCYKQAYALYESLGDRWGMARLHADIGDIAQPMADRELAILHTGASLAIYRDLGFARGIAYRLDRLGALKVNYMEFEEAERHLQESAMISEQMGDRSTLGWTLTFLGYLKFWQGLFMDATRIFNASIEINEELGRTYRTTYANIELAHIENHLGRYPEAYSLALRAEKDSERENWQVWRSVSLEAQAEALLGEGEYEKARGLCQEGIEIARNRNIAVVSSSLPILGICLHGLGDYAGMRNPLREALKISLTTYHPLAFLHIFPALALLAMTERKIERAIEYYAYAASYRHVGDSKWFTDLVGCHIERAANSLSPEAAAAARARGRILDPRQVIGDICIELGADAEKADER